MKGRLHQQSLGDLDEGGRVAAEPELPVDVDSERDGLVDRADLQIVGRVAAEARDVADDEPGLRVLRDEVVFQALDGVVEESAVVDEREKRLFVGVRGVLFQREDVQRVFRRVEREPGASVLVGVESRVGEQFGRDRLRFHGFPYGGRFGEGQPPVLQQRVHDRVGHGFGGRVTGDADGDGHPLDREDGEVRREEHRPAALREDLEAELLVAREPRVVPSEGVEDGGAL